MPARPKYQIFISSTYLDLREEREAVTWAVLTARHIPVGMEAFTATDDRGWATITSAIDRSDYYVLLLAGRYGSVDKKDGLSWTEKEYEYAVKKGLPVLVFVRSKGSITADELDDDPERATKLAAFRARVQEAHLCQTWNEKEDLVGKVSEAIRSHIIDDEDRGTTRPGWYRGNEIPSASTLEEFARLSSEAERLRNELNALRALQADAPSLALVDRQQTPVSSQYKSVRPFKIYHPALTTIAATMKETYGTQYLATNIVTPLEFGVQNIGRSLIEHVVLEITLVGIWGFKCGFRGSDLRKERGQLSNAGVGERFKSDYPNEIRLVSRGTVSFRFRIERIAAGVTEYIPPILVLGCIDQDRAYFTSKYMIAGSIGSPASGQCEYELKFEGSEEVGKKGQEADERALEVKYGTLIWSEFLFG